MKKLLALILFISMISFISCSDDNGPTVEITSPNNDSTYSAGDVIMIQGAATDDMEITSITIVGKDGFTLSESLDLSNVTDRSNVGFNLDITLTADSTPGDYSISITATDNDGNTDSEDLEFSIQ